MVALALFAAVLLAGQYSILRRDGDFKRLHVAISISVAQRTITMAKVGVGDEIFFALLMPCQWKL